MREIGERLAEQGLTVKLTDEARRWLARQGFDPQFGARPLRRALQRYLESPLSVRLLRGEYQHGDVVCVDADEQGLVFTCQRDARDESPKTALEVDVNKLQA
jgi:ATP-dependent Clp protease ATP-binding subunit ClpA